VFKISLGYTGGTGVKKEIILKYDLGLMKYFGNRLHYYRLVF